MERTSTANALLGMLTLGPMSGYDLKQRIQFSIGNFWNESFGQIYPTLKRLEEEGSVRSAEEGKAGRLVYTITDHGRERLKVWLQVPPRQRTPRNELLLKLFFGQGAAIETMRAHVLETRARYAVDLERYEKTTRPAIHERQRGMPGLPFYLSAVSYGIHQARMVIAWCDKTLAMLDATVTVREQPDIEEVAQ